jgi:hypothetical protein
MRIFDRRSSSFSPDLAAFAGEPIFLQCRIAAKLLQIRDSFGINTNGPTFAFR